MFLYPFNICEDYIFYSTFGSLVFPKSKILRTPFVFNSFNIGDLYHQVKVTYQVKVITCTPNIKKINSNVMST
jgi:hypothetical protein